MNKNPKNKEDVQMKLIKNLNVKLTNATNFMELKYP